MGRIAKVRKRDGRVVDFDSRKIADAIVHGKALRIEGGPVQVEGRRCCSVHDNKHKQEEEK